METLKLQEEIRRTLASVLSGIVCGEEQKILLKQIMKAINSQANKIDVGEMIKTLIWEYSKKHLTYSYGNLSEYIEKQIVKSFK